MKMHLEHPQDLNIIRAYAPGQVTINQDIYTQSLIVLPRQIIADWMPKTFEDLTAVHFDVIAELSPEVVVLGTGKRLRFPRPTLIATLVNANIGMEVMDTAAACRTYNILMGEGRNVAAALLI